MLKTKFRSPMTLMQVRQTEVYKTVKQHWMQALVVIGLCFIVLKKDIQIQLNLSNAPTAATKETNKNEVVSTPVKKEETSIAPVESSKQIGASKVTDSGALNQLAIIDPVQLWSMLKHKVMDKPVAPGDEVNSELTDLEVAAAPEVTKPVKKKSVAKKAKTKGGAAPVANNYSYLTFVLSPTYAKRKGIPQSLVDEKLNACRDYINRFAPVAKSEEKKYGIPASIKLAQALLESNAGESRLSRQNNNHFGIKCFLKNCSKGHCGNFTDDSHKDFFRNYSNTWESYRAHSVFLQGKRYKGLQTLGVDDYKAWAHGLKKAGYATDKKYAEKLIRIIEFFDLDKL